MRNGDILKEYYCNLLEDVADSKHNLNDYCLLLNVLFDIPFTYSIEMDENRAFDAKTLRDDICNEYDLQFDVILKRKISVLEVLIALAKRIETDILMDPMSGKDNSSTYFWEMLRNLGLEDLKNDVFSEAKVRFKVEKWLKREFDRDGFGSIFPLKRPKCDQRRIEIWSQMQAYLGENY